MCFPFAKKGIRGISLVHRDAATGKAVLASSGMSQEGSPHHDDLESTASLLRRVRHGSEEARDRLVRRYLPALRRWAHGRLPARARDLLDTDDLVQVTLLRALDRVDGFQVRRDGGFLAYLRRILMNQIRDELRRVAVRPGRQQLDEEPEACGPSPLEELIGKESLEAYERALASLTEAQQEAVMMRVEMGFTHRQIAEALGSPSENAARMMVARALLRLSEVMGERG